MDKLARDVQTLFTNSKSRKDFLRGAFDEFSKTPQHVMIAVAFLTDPQPILKLAANGSQVKVIVRLGYPTLPNALKLLLEAERIQVRAVSATTFHPKLYIFSEDGALVGSSNMTQSALNTNQEVNVLIHTEDVRFKELETLFREYWNQVVPLDELTIEKYRAELAKFQRERKAIDDMNIRIDALIPSRIANIDRGKRDVSKFDQFTEEYRSEYQGFLDAFRTVRRVYEASKRRKYAEEVVPIRLEVDAFLGWIRGEYTAGNSYLNEKFAAGPELEKNISRVLDNWFQSKDPHIDDVALRRYPLVTRTLGSPEAIADATYDEIVDALSCETSFYDRLRFFPGGHETHVEVFKAANPVERVRRVLTYLLFGEENPVVRMYRCVHEPEFHLEQFGRSNVQELLGWVNDGEVPICNNRTLRSLRYLGFDVKTHEPRKAAGDADD